MKTVGASGLEVEVGREAADVPAVAHRPERQQRDHRVLGGVQRAEQASASPPARRACSGLGQVPDRLGLETSSRAGRASTSLERRLVADRLLLVADHLLGDA